MKQYTSKNLRALSNAANKVSSHSEDFSQLFIQQTKSNVRRLITEMLCIRYVINQINSIMGGKQTSQRHRVFSSPSVN